MKLIINYAIDLMVFIFGVLLMPAIGVTGSIIVMALAILDFVKTELMFKDEDEDWAEF